MKRKMIIWTLALVLIYALSFAALAETGETGNPSQVNAADTCSSPSVRYSGTNVITSSVTQNNIKYDSKSANQNALLIDTSSYVEISNPYVTKTGDSKDGDNYNYYGINSGIMVLGGCAAKITGGVVNTAAKGANGVFSYGGTGRHNGTKGDNTTIRISDTAITTTGDNSEGIMTAGGGIIIADNITVTTSGRSSAPLRTDRGGGKVTATGGTYISKGICSPAIYCTADIVAEKAVFVSELSEGVRIEGDNSVTLKNCDLAAHDTQMSDNKTFLDTIMLYRSIPGDTDSGTSSFLMKGGSLKSQNGHIFHVANTNALISLSGVSITNEDEDNVLISVCDDGCSDESTIAVLSADAQFLSGDILVGENSILTLNLTNISKLDGSVPGKIVNEKGDVVSTDTGAVNVTIDEGSKWSLTADSYITAFEGSAASVINNGFKLYVNGVELRGTIERNNSNNAQTENTGSVSKNYTYMIPVSLLLVLAFVRKIRGKN